MLLNLIPLTQCNFRCSYCYFGKEALSDPKVLDLGILKNTLEEFKPIDHIDCYGGEITMLTDEYMVNLLDIASQYTTEQVSCISNGTRIPWWMMLPTVLPTFTWDYNCRQDWKLVQQNLMEFKKPFALLMVATKTVMSRPVDKIIEAINAFPYVDSFEIKPYAPNQFNHFRISNTEFEDFIKKFITAGSLKPTFVNQEKLETVLSGQKRSEILEPGFFLFPDGKIGSFIQNPDDKEMFIRYNSKAELEASYRERNAKVRSNPYCAKCEHLYSCISENFREVKHLDDSCDGFINLIGWYKQWKSLTAGTTPL